MRRKLLCVSIMALLVALCCASFAGAEEVVEPRKVYLPKTANVYVADSITLTPTCLPDDAQTTFTWKSGDTKIATVTEAGVVTGVKAGSVSVTVTTANGKKAVCKVKVLPPAVLLPKTGSVYVGRQITIEPTVLPAGYAGALTWKSSNVKIATVDEHGVVTGVKVGAVSVTATLDNGKKAVCKVKVTPATITLDKTDSVDIGHQRTLTPVVLPSGYESPVAWKSSNVKIATVDESGVVTGVKAGTAVITASLNNGQKSACKVKVTPVSLINVTAFDVLDFEGKSRRIEVEGETYYMDAVGHKMTVTLQMVEPSDADTAVTWKSGNTKVATVDKNGVITCKKKGVAVVIGKAKYGIAEMRLNVVVLDNSAEYTFEEVFSDVSELEQGVYGAAKRVYLSGNYVCVDMYIFNNTANVLPKGNYEPAPITVAFDETHQYLAGQYPLKLSKAVAPHGYAVATYKLTKWSKFNPAQIRLISAFAYIGTPTEPKAAADRAALAPFRR